MRQFDAHIEETRPDWVMLGVPGPLDEQLGGGQGVWLYASKDLGRAELEVQVERDQYALDGGLYYEWVPEWISPPRTTITLTARMRTFVVIMAPDYPAAFRALFEQWQPPVPARPQIGEEQRSIEAPPYLP